MTTIEQNELTSLQATRDMLKASIAERESRDEIPEGAAAVTAHERTRLADVEARIAELEALV